VGVQRIERLRQVNQELIAELEALDEALEHGGLALVRYFMENRSNPRLTEQLALLEQRWANSQTPPSAGELLQQIKREVVGDY
jgi:hypothetical protein